MKNSLKEKEYHLFFKNLANPLRIKIIAELKKEPSSVNKLSNKLAIEQSKLSHALINLKKCNFVDFKQKGKQRIYFLNKKTIIPILKLVDNHAKISCKCSGCSIKNCGGEK